MSARPSDSLRLERAKLIRVADIAELIVASGQMPAHKGRTYDCTVPRSSLLTKRLANRAVPHMSQSQNCTPKHSHRRAQAPWPDRRRLARAAARRTFRLCDDQEIPGGLRARDAARTSRHRTARRRRAFGATATGCRSRRRSFRRRGESDIRPTNPSIGNDRVRGVSLLTVCSPPLHGENRGSGHLVGAD